MVTQPVSITKQTPSASCSTKRPGIDGDAQSVTRPLATVALNNVVQSMLTTEYGVVEVSPQTPRVTLADVREDMVMANVTDEVRASEDETTMTQNY